MKNNKKNCHSIIRAAEHLDQSKYHLQKHIQSFCLIPDCSVHVWCSYRPGNTADVFFYQLLTCARADESNLRQTSSWLAIVISPYYGGLIYPTTHSHKHVETRGVCTGIFAELQNIVKVINSCNKPLPAHVNVISKQTCGRRRAPASDFTHHAPCVTGSWFRIFARRDVVYRRQCLNEETVHPLWIHSVTLTRTLQPGKNNVILTIFTICSISIMCSFLW